MDTKCLTQDFIRNISTSAENMLFEISEKNNEIF